MLVVVKIGSAVLVDKTGRVDHDRIAAIAGDVAALRSMGHQVALVSSGAVSAGRGRLANANDEVSKRVLAAIGQPIIFAEYLDAFDKLGVVTAQCLFERPDFSVYERYLNSISSLAAMVDAGVVPVINENDFVADEQTTVGDNDALAATVAIGMRADRLILFTSQPGLYSSASWREGTPQLESVVENVDIRFQKSFERSPGQGRGGVHSKVRAARLAASVGIETFILDGRVPGLLQQTFGAEGSTPGTRFPGHDVPMQPSGPKERWLLATRTPGQIVIDAGACAALTNRGSSLLLYGIVAVRGTFLQNEVVEILGPDSQQIGLGLSNYGSGELRRALDAKRSLEAGRSAVDETQHELVQMLQAGEPWLGAITARFLEGREAILNAAIEQMELHPGMKLPEAFAKSLRERQSLLFTSLVDLPVPPAGTAPAADRQAMVRRVMEKWLKVSEMEAGAHRVRNLIHGVEKPLLKSLASRLGDQMPAWKKVRETVEHLENEEERVRKAGRAYRDFGQREVVHRDNMLFSSANRSKSEELVA